MSGISPPTGQLRPMTTDDLDMVRTWRNHPDIARHMLNSERIHADDHAAWFARSLELPHRHLLIYSIDTPCGFVQFNAIDPKGRIAEWGFYLAPEAPRGTGQSLGRCALNYAFDKIDLHKVFGQVLGSNQRSLRFHERLGFAVEGILREQHIRQGDFEDLHCYGLLQREWRERSAVKD